MTRFFSIGLGAVTSLVLAGVFGTQAVEWGTGSTAHTDHLQYSQGIRNLDVTSTNGTIVLQHTSGSKLTVARTVRESMRAAPTSAQVRGQTLSLSGGCGHFLSGPCSVSYVIGVPDTVSVTANARNASITASGIHGPTALSTSNGSIDVSNVAGDLSAETSSGSISARGIDGGTVVLRTGSGSIHAAGIDAQRVSADTGSGGIGLGIIAVPDSVTAHTGSGNATIDVPDGQAYDVQTESGSGGTDNLVRQDSTSQHHIEVRTGSGHIRVEYGP